MKLNALNTQNLISYTTSTAVSTADSESQSIQNQISNAQQRLNHLSSDSQITSEEKNKERLELQKQIAELNRKLRQHRMEQKEKAAETAKEEQKKTLLKEGLREEMAEEETPKAKSQSNSTSESPKEEKLLFAADDLQKIFSTDSLLQQERIRENVENQKDGQVRILEAEIHSDSLYGTNTDAKKEQLSAMRKENAFQVEEIRTSDKQKPSAIPSNTKIIISE